MGGRSSPAGWSPAGLKFDHGNGKPEIEQRREIPMVEKIFNDRLSENQPAQTPANALLVRRMRRFLQRVLPRRGLYGWMARQKGAVVGRGLCRDINELITTLCRHNLQGDDTYFNLATFVHPGGVLGKDGKWHLRSQDNADVRCTLSIDIDTKISKPNAHYADQAEAKAAVERMCEVEQLPLPIFINSGGGLHCHWPLDRELTPAEWRPYAVALKAACIAHGIHADHQVTVNVVGVLRPVDTHHVKTGNVVKVISKLVGPYPLSPFEHLKQFVPKEPRKPKPAAGRSADGQSPIADAVRANIFDPSDPAKIVKACRQLGALATDPGAFSEPMHHAAAGVFGNCGRDGERFYLDLLDDEWQAAGQDKLNRWLGGGWGPTTCRRIDDLNPGGCDGCPFKGEIASPIVLGRRYAPIVLPNDPPVALPW
jgi:hypothetical protein